MGTLLLSLVFAVGLVVLWIGARGLVSGSASLALRLGIRPAIVGLTVVAFGTSAPELVVSVMAAVSGSPDVALGNVVGSNIANVCLIVGLVALFTPIPSDRTFLKRDMPLLFAAMVLLFLLSFDLVISRLDGAALLLGLFVFLLVIYRSTVGKGRPPAPEAAAARGMSRGMAALYTAGGLVLLTVGARLMVDSAVQIARGLGISEAVIGATIVAVGTSLPELATSLAAVIKKEPDIGLGNAIGSNVFNICSILGIAPLVSPLAVPPRLLRADFPVMAISAAVFYLMLAKRSNRITQPEGMVLFAGYVAYVTWSFWTG